MRRTFLGLTFVLGLLLPGSVSSVEAAYAGEETMYKLRFVLSGNISAPTPITCARGETHPAALLFEECFQQRETGISITSHTFENKGYALVFWSELLKTAWRHEFKGTYRIGYTEPELYKLGSGQTVEAAVVELIPLLKSPAGSVTEGEARVRALFDMGRTVVYVSSALDNPRQNLEKFLPSLHLVPVELPTK